MNENGSDRRKRKRLQVRRKRAIKRYTMLALIMGTVGFLMMLVEEMVDYQEKASLSTSPFSDERAPSSLFSSDPGRQQNGGGSSQKNLSVEQMQEAAKTLGIIK